MIRRIILLLASAALGWFLVSRLRRPKEVYVGDEADPWPDAEGGDFTERSTEAAAGAMAVSSQPAETPVDRIRSIVGEGGGGMPEGEPVMPPEGGGEEPAATATLVGVAAMAEETGRVKGNINRDGEKIYHLPGDAAYERTNAERMFLTVEEAEAAGFRRAGQRQGD
jgi:hypothetical protein